MAEQNRYFRIANFLAWVARALKILSVFFLGNFAYAGNISGTYVGIYTNAADMLQIVEQPDGSIIGRFEQVILITPKAEIQRMNALVSGAISGNTLVLTLKPAEFLGRTIPMSGTINRDVISLSGGSNGGSFSFVAKRSPESTFIKQVENLVGQASRAQELRAEQKSLEEDRKNIAHVTQRFRDISSNAAVHIKRASAAPAICAEYTKKMSAALTREGKYPRGSYARSQIQYEISSIAFNFGLWHDGLQRVEWSHGYNDGKIVLGQSLKAQITKAQQTCSHPDWAVSQFCKDFLSAHTNFESTLEQLRSGFDSAEAAWHAEYVKQKELQKRAASLNP